MKENKQVRPTIVNYRSKEIIQTNPTYKGTTSKQMINQPITEDPEKINIQNVCYWYEEKGYLFGSQKGKAKRFIELDLIKPMSQDRYEILPLPGNHQTHIVEKINSAWKCGCQRNRLTNKICSHIDAVKLKLFMEKWNGN